MANWRKSSDRENVSEIPPAVDDNTFTKMSIITKEQDEIFYFMNQIRKGGNITRDSNL